MTPSEIDADNTARIEETIRTILKNELPDTFVFDPIVVKPKTDHDGDRYFHSYIVFEGENSQLDPAWTMTLPGRLWRISADMGYHGIPINSFVPKPEWKNLQKAMR